jgi:hypothetical protein
MPQGFGRHVLGKTWLSHHGRHGKESTRGLFDPGAAEHPILRGINDGDIWGPTDVYGVRLPLPGDAKPLILGQVLTGMQPGSPPVASPAERADAAGGLNENLRARRRPRGPRFRDHDGGGHRPGRRGHPPADLR